MSHNPNETTEHIVSNMINWSDKVIKSQHELNTCNDGKRSSDVLIATIEELERTKKQLEIAVKRIEFLKKKTSSPYYGNNTYLKTIYQMCDKTLRQIEDLNK